MCHGCWKIFRRTNTMFVCGFTPSGREMIGVTRSKPVIISGSTRNALVVRRRQPAVGASFSASPSRKLRNKRRDEQRTIPETQQQQIIDHGFKSGRSASAMGETRIHAKKTITIVAGELQKLQNFHHNICHVRL
mmetsp:Transcript_24693/g.52178  ORF Transcript_24693/g.52178 Transcript_24693/m.52178 type:complete len:134 (-) Transcript_24693:28-429(-)